MKRMRAGLAAMLAVGLWGGNSVAAEPLPPALQVRLIRPDLQCGRLIDLFDGARAPHPAAALAGWKRASRAGLSKQTEALITMMNPLMVPEFKALDAAEVVIRYDPEGAGPLRWFAVAPRDDGTFAAVATALVLTDGAGDPPLDGLPVDRLGPLGAPVMARSARVVALATTRDDLRIALAIDPVRVAGLESGARFRLDPDGLGTTGTIERRRLAEALRALGCESSEGALHLEGQTLTVDLTTRLGTKLGAPAIDPAWLDWAPAAGAAAVAAVALDPRPESWEVLFALADGVDRADPERAKLAPLRTRLNLIALVAKVRLEVDLWPRLRGLTAVAFTDEDGAWSGAALALHALDLTAAERIEAQVLPRMSAPGRKAPPTGGLGKLSGKPLLIARRDTTILIGWGEPAFSACLDAGDHPDHSAGPALRARLGPKPLQRAGALWPAQIAPNLGRADPSPILWQGRTNDDIASDVLHWTGLQGAVRRFLDRLPLAPPPDQGPSPR